MEHGIWRRVCLVATVAAALWGAAPQEAEANANFFQLWQTRGGDASRDGHVGGGNIVRNPRVTVRVNAASVDEAASAALADLDGDGVAEELGIDDGAVVALRQDLSTLWEGGALGLRRLEAVRDLDGDGTPEILASGGGQLYILRGSNGEAAFNLGLDAGDEIVLRDLDGDELPEVLVRGTQPQPTLRAYRFSEGGGQLLWQLMEGLPEDGFDFTVGDADGQSPWEVFVDSRQGGRVLVWNAATGEALRQREEPTLFGEGGCGPSWFSQIDEDAQAEVFLTSTRRTAEAGSVYVAAYDYVNDSVEWSYEFGARGIGAQAMDVPWRPARDLDGDGAPEVLLSVFNNTREIELDGQATDQDGLDVPGNWLTVAYSAATGEVVSAINGRRVVGVVDVPGQNPVVLLKLGGDVEEMPVTRQLLEAAQLVEGQWRTLWRMPVATALVDSSLSQTSCAGADQGALPRLLTTDTDGDGSPELAVVRYLDGDELPDVIQTISLGTDTPRIVGQRLLDSVSVAGVGVGTGVLGPQTPHMEVRLGDGYLTALGEDLGSARRASLGHGVSTLRGLKIEIDNSSEYHLRVQAPNGPLRVLDPSALDGASAAQLWEAPEDAWTPDLVFVDPDTDLSLMPVGRREGESYVLEAFDDLGEAFWSQTLTGATGWPSEMTYAHVGGLEREDLVYILPTAEGPVLEARDGATGEVLHSVPLSSIPGASLNSRLLRIPGEEAEDFRDENETDDLVMIHEQDASVLEGETFAVLRGVSTGPGAYLSALVDIDGDDTLDILVQSPDGTRSARRLDNDELLWTLPLEPSYMGSPETLPGLVQFLSGDNISGARAALGGAFGDLTLYDHATGERLWSVCLEQGQATTIPMGVALDAQACGGSPMADLTTARPGFGTEDQILVGSRDGWVYVIRSQDGAVEWSYALHRPLGPVVVADGDGDRNSELVVSSDNGSFYAFKGRFDPTTEVRDVVVGDEDDAVQRDVDQSQQDHTRALAFAWEHVLGADVYHVAVLGDDEFMVPLTEATNDNGFVYVAEPGQLKPGVTYRAAVQVESTSGQLSPLTLSDGVTIVDEQPPAVTVSRSSGSPVSPAQGQGVDLALTASDNMGLRQVVLTATQEGAQEPAWTRTWSLRYATSWAEDATWGGVDDQGMPLPDGAYTLRAVALDYGDLTAEATAQVSLDSTGPEAPTWTAPEAQAVLGEARPTLSGTAEAGARVVVTLDEAVFCEVTADEAGAFSCDAQEDLADGEHSATAQAFDALENPGAVSEALIFRLDLTPPAAPAVVAPTEGQVFLVDEPAPVELVVQAEAGSVVTVFLGEEEVCQINEADPEDETRYLCQSAALEPGTYSATAQATDTFGRGSELSPAISFTVEMNPIEEPDMGTDADMEEDMVEPDMGEDMAEPDAVEPDMDEDTGVDAGEDASEGDAGGQDMGDQTEVSVGGASDDGCGCAVPARRAPVTPWLVSLTLGAALLWWRRRR